MSAIRFCRCRNPAAGRGARPPEATRQCLRRDRRVPRSGRSVGVHPGQVRVEDRILGLLDSRGGDIDGIVRVGLRPIGLALGVLPVELRRERSSHTSRWCAVGPRPRWAAAPRHGLAKLGSLWTPRFAADRPQQGHRHNQADPGVDRRATALPLHVSTSSRWTSRWRPGRAHPLGACGSDPGGVGSTRDRRGENRIEIAVNE